MNTRFVLLAKTAFSDTLEDVNSKIFYLLVSFGKLQNFNYVHPLPRKRSSVKSIPWFYMHFYMHFSVYMTLL